VKRRDLAIWWVTRGMKHNIEPLRSFEALYTEAVTLSERMKGEYKGLSSRGAREKYLRGVECERKRVLWSARMT
jgi:hypothetical protein